MTNRIDSAFSGSTLRNFANFRFKEQVNTADKLRPGAVCAGCIEFDLFTDGGETVPYGDTLTYYQVDDNNNAVKIGEYTAETVTPGKHKLGIIAYDNIVKLEMDFSYRLAQLQNAFPISLGNLVQYACDVSGVTFGTPNFPLNDILVEKFYAEGLSCRQIVAWAAEIACCFVKCNEDGEIEFQWYEEAEEYRIYPTSGSSGGETYVYYKLDGLKYSEETSATVDYVRIQTDSSDGGGYVFPSSYAGTYATDITGNGNIQLYHFAAADNGDLLHGDIILVDNNIYSTDTTNDGNISMMVREESSNVYLIADNLLLTNASDSVLYRVAKHLYDELDAMPEFRETEVDLFPFFNPFRAGQIAKITDVQGVSFVFPIMEMDVGDGKAHLVSENGLAYNGRNLASYKETTSYVAANILRLQSLIVEQLRATNATIENLWTQNLTVSGILHSADYHWREGNTYADSGLSIDFLNKVVRTPFFAVQDGRLYALLGKVGAFNLWQGAGVYTYPTNASFYDQNGDPSTNYTVDGRNIVVGENGELVYPVPKTQTGSDGIAYGISKLWLQTFYGGTTTEGWDTPAAWVEYLDSQGGVIHSTQWSGLHYQPAGSELGSTFTLNQTYVTQCDRIAIRVRVSTDDISKVQEQFGLYSSMYTNVNRLAGSAENIYIGTDGISVGENIILTPDGHGHFANVSADGIQINDTQVPVIMRGSVVANSDEFTIDFGYTFDDYPNVVLTPFGESGVDKIAACYPISVRKSNVVVRYRIFNGTTWSTPSGDRVRWLAIGN